LQQTRISHVFQILTCPFERGKNLVILLFIAISLAVVFEIHGQFQRRIPGGQVQAKGLFE
jgi:hypothetical protein